MSSSRSTSLSAPPADDSDWYDPEESERDLAHPKYWDEEDGEVFVGIKQRKAPAINLSTLCGTYRFFYEFPVPGTTDPVEVVYYDTASSSKAQSPGHITIQCPPNKKPTLKNITGTVVHYGKEAKFAGIRRAKDREKTRLVDNHWEFVSFRWKAEYGDNQDEGNSISALAIEDDNGDPFIMFRYASAGRDGDDLYLDIAAKKDRKKGSGAYGLTRAERERLGMDARYPEVRAAAMAAAAAAAAAANESSDESASESSADESDSESAREYRRTASKRKHTASEERQPRSKKRKAH